MAQTLPQTTMEPQTGPFEISFGQLSFEFWVAKNPQAADVLNEKVEAGPPGAGEPEMESTTWGLLK